MWFWITLAIIVIILFVISLLIYNSVFGKRVEKVPGLKYYDVSEFPGVNKTPYSFVSKDHKINGFIYELENNEPKGIVIVVHGAGGGHDSYMHEICYFAKLGYKVFAYDNTGTMLSEGDKLRGFEQSLLDLRECILDIQSSLEYAGLKIILYGHSWGAFTVSSVSNYDDVKVDGIVSLSAFNHPLIELTRMLTEQIGKFFYVLFPFLWIISFAKFGKVALFTSLKGYQKCNCPVLIVHGTLDKMVPISDFRKFREKLKENKNIEFIELPTKYHRPNITDDGVIYDNAFNLEAAKIMKENGDLKAFYEQADYKLLTKFDDRVMDRVKSFVERI